ncbi:MAG TPA: hypothetical protein VFV96_02030 [Verrucomicrobiae bacterium]|nr:hypothetical protein [Verrucomicrobiae bacterium]
MNANQHGEGASFLHVLMNAIEENKRFAPKYRAARNRDELLLEFAEALVLASRFLVRSVQGKEDLRSPNLRLFCECLEMNRKALLDELGGKLSSDEAIQVYDNAAAFACAVFAQMCGLSDSQKKSLLQNLGGAYLNNLGRETNEACSQLLEIAGIPPSPRSVAEIVVCWAKKPWLITEPDDFLKCWKVLPVIE